MARLKEIMRQHSTFFFGLLLVIVGLSFIYRAAILHGEILFPSNLLATFYSPWSTKTFKGWEQGIPNKPIGGNDQVRLFYPDRTFSNQQIARGLLPTWDPYIFAGSPHLANFQSAIFYPLNIVYLMFPQMKAWSLLIIMPFLLGFIGMYLFLRSIRITPLAAIIGSIAFSFSGFICTWSQENAAAGQASIWLPFMLWGTERLIKTGSLHYLGITAFLMATSLLSGFYQITFYCYVVTFAYGGYRLFLQKERRGKTVFLFFLSFLFSFALSAIQLIPSAEAFYQSPRSSASVSYLFNEYLLPLTHLVHIVLPDILGNPGTYSYIGKGFYHETVLYIGIVPLIFALFAALTCMRKSPVFFFTGVAVVSYFMTLKSPFTIWFYQLPIPIVTTFLPSRILYVTGTALSVLAAFGVAHYMEGSKTNYRKLLLICLVLGIFAAVPLIYVASGKLFTASAAEHIRQFVLGSSRRNEFEQSVMLKNMLLPETMLVISAVLLQLRLAKRKIVYLLILITAFGQFFYLNKYAVIGFPQFLYPEHFLLTFLAEKKSDLYRFVAFGRPILGNVALDKEVFSPEGLDAVFPNRYGQLVFATKNDGNVIANIPRIEVTLFELNYPETMLDNARRLRLISFLGVKYLFFYLEKPISENDLPKKFPDSLVTPLWSRDNWYAYENKQVFPRAFLASNYVVEKDPQKIVDAFYDPQTNLAKTAILEEKLPSFTQSLATDTEDTKATITQYKPERIEIQTKTDVPRILVLTDNYYPGWTAAIDGVPTKIYRADYTFRAVAVPAGVHRVTFVYAPQTVKIGAYITLSTLIVLIVLQLFSAYTNKSRYLNFDSRKQTRITKRS